MVFSSVVFLFGYLPVVLAVYYWLPTAWRNGWLFAVSLFFYGFGEPVYILVMLFSVTVAYLCAFPIGRHRRNRPRAARAWLAVSLLLNLATLLFFKYTNFFLSGLAHIPVLSVVLTPIQNSLSGLSLPIGISFYTFQIMSYSIDLYRGETETQRSLVAFGTYVALFPQLVAGPIVRYRDIDDQLAHRTHTVDKFASGVKRFAVGFAKKALLGDSLAALYAYLGTAAAVERTVLGSWLMVIAYTLHIYFDFSGYSDMAIGLGRMLGFSFCENFRYPYAAGSVTDFWRRWHISLSSWFREYVYIPLGGNRCGRWRQVRNMAVVWLLTGLWHGASWNFVLWGLFYFVCLVLEKCFLLKMFSRHRRTRVLGHIWTLFAVGVSWMLFDHTDLCAALSVIGGLFGVGTAPSPVLHPVLRYELLRALPLLAISAVAATPLPSRLWERLRNKHPALALAEPVWVAFLFVLATAYTVSGTFSPFLYFIF